jgi:hypothetical protein
MSECPQFGPRTGGPETPRNRERRVRQSRFATSLLLPFHASREAVLPFLELASIFAFF